MGDSIMAYAQPLIHETDGSKEQMDLALALSQTCWNLAIMPEAARNEALREMGPGLKMGAEEFETFRRSIIEPMIRRHEEMFPGLHGQGSSWGLNRAVRAATPSSATQPVSRQEYPGTGRNAPCPCNSGKKYKKCCGR
jgi:hypothetical protein